MPVIGLRDHAAQAKSRDSNKTKFASFHTSTSTQSYTEAAPLESDCAPSVRIGSGKNGYILIHHQRQGPDKFYIESEISPERSERLNDAGKALLSTFSRRQNSVTSFARFPTMQR